MTVILTKGKAKELAFTVPSLEWSIWWHQFDSICNRFQPVLWQYTCIWVEYSTYKKYTVNESAQSMHYNKNTHGYSSKSDSNIPYTTDHELHIRTARKCSRINGNISFLYAFLLFLPFGQTAILHYLLYSSDNYEINITLVRIAYIL